MVVLLVGCGSGQQEPEGLTVIRAPSAHCLRTTNMLENVNKQIKRRTRVAGLFPHPESALRLVSAVLMEISEDWEPATSTSAWMLSSRPGLLYMTGKLQKETCTPSLRFSGWWDSQGSGRSEPQDQGRSWVAA